MKLPTAETENQEPWYKSAFQADYLERYAHRNVEEAQLIFQLLSNQAKLSTSEYYLDLCCGAGRHSQVFCEKGYKIVGLDLSEDLLRAANNQPCRHARYVRADMRLHPFFCNTFGGVMHLFTAFGYFHQDEQNAAVFQEVHRILKPGGWYLFDFLNATKVQTQITHIPTTELEVHKTLGRLRTTKQLSADGKRVVKRIQFLDSTVQREFVEDVALYNGEELTTMLLTAGLRLNAVFGSYAGEAFNEGSTRWIALCEKPA